MRRGTTPTNVIHTDLDLTTALSIYLTYSQNKRNIIEKELPDMEVTKERITVHLSQKDTLCLLPDVPVKVQVRAKFPDGSAVASNIMSVSVNDILKDGEI